MAQQWQTNLKANEIAPFDGVLVPYETYRKMSRQDLESDLLKSELTECYADQPEHTNFSSYEWFMTGAIAGALSVFFISKK